VFGSSCVNVRFGFGFVRFHRWNWKDVSAVWINCNCKYELVGEDRTRGWIFTVCGLYDVFSPKDCVCVNYLGLC